MQRLLSARRAAGEMEGENGGDKKSSGDRREMGEAAACDNALCNLQSGLSRGISTVVCAGVSGWLGEWLVYCCDGVCD